MGVRHNQYRRKFCSTACAFAFRQTDESKQAQKTARRATPWNKGLVAKDDSRIRAGQNNPKWNGGRQRANGYVVLYLPNYLSTDKDGRIYEHRYVMEQFLGRPLVRGEIVHHINGIKDDNRIENLSLETEKTHKRPHAEVIGENRRLRAENQRLLLLLASLCSVGLNFGMEGELQSELQTAA